MLAMVPVSAHGVLVAAMVPAAVVGVLVAVMVPVLVVAVLVAAMVHVPVVGVLVAVSLTGILMADAVTSRLVNMMAHHLSSVTDLSSSLYSISRMPIQFSPV